MDEEGVNVEEDDEDEEDQIFALGGGRMCSLAVLIRADKCNACPSEVAAVASKYATSGGWRRRARGRGRKGAELATRYREGSSRQTQTCMIMTEYTVTILRVPRSKLSHAERIAAAQALRERKCELYCGRAAGDGSIICSRYRRRKPGGALEA